MKDRELIDALKELVVLAVRVFRALPDPDARFQAMGKACAFSDRADPWFGYGGSTIRVRFIPTPKEVSQAERVNEWLVWLSQQSATAFDRLIDWANGTPTWRIAMREKCTPRTIHNRLDRSLSSIAKQFGNVIIEIEAVEEKHEYPLHFAERPTQIGSATELLGSKTYSGDRREYVINGRRWRDGKERIRA